MSEFGCICDAASPWRGAAARPASSARGHNGGRRICAGPAAAAVGARGERGLQRQPAELARAASSSAAESTAAAPPSSLRPGARPPPPWQTSSSAVALLGGGPARRRPSAPSARRRWAARRAGAAGGSDPDGRAAPSPAPSLAGLLRLRSGICTGNLQASNSRPARVSAAASGSTQPLVIFFLFFLIFMK